MANVTTSAGNFAEKGSQWIMLIIALVAGTAGGFGFRQVDSNVWDRRDGKELETRVTAIEIALEKRVTALEIRLDTFDNPTIVRGVDRLEYRMNRVEKILDSIKPSIE